MASHEISGLPPLHCAEPPQHAAFACEIEFIRELRAICIVAQRSAEVTRVNLLEEAPHEVGSRTGVEQPFIEVEHELTGGTGTRCGDSSVRAFEGADEAHGY